MIDTALKRPSFYAEQYNHQGDLKMAGDRNIEIKKGNYNENIQGNYYEQSGNFGIGHMSGGEIQDGAKVAGVINEAGKNINRYTRIDFPPEIIIEHKADLIIQLVVQIPKQTRVLQKISISTDSDVEAVKIDVQITAENFAMQQRRKQLILPVDGNSEEVVFQLVPIELGEQIIEVEFFHDCSRVGYAIVKTNVKGLIT